MSLLLSRFLGIALIPADNRSTGQSLFHYFLSIGGEFRQQMHSNVWLVAGAFGALAVAGLLWVIAEKWQMRSEWSVEDELWMIGFGAVLGLGALLYRAATQGAMARRFAMSRNVADVIGVGIVLAVPVVLWFRWHEMMQNNNDDMEEERALRIHSSPTILGLGDFSPPAPAPLNGAVDAKESALVEAAAIQPAARLERAEGKLDEFAKEQPGNEIITMENPDNLRTNGQPAQYEGDHPAASEPIKPQAAIAEPLMAHSFPNQPVSQQQRTSQQPAAEERSSVPAASFRDQLSVLNASWNYIEEAGKEIEDWFQLQQKRVFAHLERPAAKTQENQAELSHDFLEQKMNKVDAEWAAIHRTVREMYRWLENGNAEKEEPVQETKVW
jgi:hypothetical protein